MNAIFTNEPTNAGSCLRYWVLKSVDNLLIISPRIKGLIRAADRAKVVSIVDLSPAACTESNHYLTGSCPSEVRRLILLVK